MKKPSNRATRVAALQSYSLRRSLTVACVCAAATLGASVRAADRAAPVAEPSNKAGVFEYGPAAEAIGWPGLEIQLPHEIVWTSSRIKTPSADRRTLIAKGRDAMGPTQLIVSQFGDKFAARLWDGAGIHWESIGEIASPVHFRKANNGKEQHCGGTPPVPPEIQAQFRSGAADQGGVAGACIDAETLDVMVAYSPCALQQFHRDTLFPPPPVSPEYQPPCADPQVPPLPSFDPDEALEMLKTRIFLEEDTINLSLDNSLISIPSHQRHIRIVAIVDTNQTPECQPGTWDPDPVDPGYSCYQFYFDPEAVPQDCDPLEPAWCGETIEFGDDLDRVSNPADPDYGGLLAQKRDYHRADFVVLLRVTGLEGIGGIARLKAQNSGCNGSTGFCVVDIMSMGSMGHEMGHNFGCCHEPGQGGSFNCSMFPYSFGHRFTVDNPGGSPLEMKTIMAYPTGEGVPFWSNPSVLFDGEPTGTFQTQYPYWSDNARTIRETFDDARCYRCADRPPTPLTVGTVKCWGSNSHGQTTVPTGMEDATHVAAGYLHTVALDSTGMVWAWGAGSGSTGSSPHFGQSNVPVNMPEPPYGDGFPLGACRDVAAGLYHSAAIRKLPTDDPLDGSVICWGAGSTSQTTSPHFGQSIVPGFVGACSKVSAGSYHTLGLRRDGAVRAWGAGTSSFGPWPHLGQSQVPAVAALGACSDIAAGGYHSVAIRQFAGIQGGTVVAWGAGTTNSGTYAEYGQSIVPAALGNCLQVAAGVYHTVALKVDGTVRAWGAGVTNTGIFPRYGQSIIPASLGACLDVSAGGTYAGGSHTLAIKAGQTLAAWGAGTTNGASPHFGQSIPPAPALANVVKISAGGFHSAAVSVAPPLAPCIGDLNADGQRDGADVATMLSAWGSAAGDCNGDGTTDGTDLTYLLSGWGLCP